jgi:hypothetical protein
LIRSVITGRLVVRLMPKRLDLVLTPTERNKLFQLYRILRKGFASCNGSA